MPQMKPRRRAFGGALTVKRVEKALRAGKPLTMYDGHGLRLVIRGPHSAAWETRIQRDGRVSWPNVGPAWKLTLAEARERNRQLHLLADTGVDPVAQKRAAKLQRQLDAARSVTFAEAFSRFYGEHRTKWSSPKYAAQWSEAVGTYVLPLIGQLPVSAIDVPTVLAVMEQPIAASRHGPAGRFWQARHVTARNVLGRIAAVLDWAKARRLREGDNPASWDVIGKVLPSLPSARHHAALPFKDVPGFVGELCAHGGVAAAALQFAILTASRAQEALEARWGEFDLDAAIWTVPAARMKMRREHRVPLAPEAVALLRELPREGDGPFVFIGAVRERPVSYTAVKNLLRQLRPGITLHGFRSSFRDWAGERTAFPHDVCEAALAHIRGDKAVQAYARGDLLDRRRQLMAAWARYCNEPMKAGDVGAVLPLRTAQP
jgi:integrase